MVNACGELIYIGKAKSLRARLLSYFRPRSRDPKAGRILAQTGTLVWEASYSEFGALLRELELIRRWRPVFNVQGQPGRRRRTYLCLGRRPAPYLFLTARPPAGVLACYGPLPASRAAREAVRRLNDRYGLRDCPRSQDMIFADQAELFPLVRAAGCIRYEIGTCLGPCAAACSRADYGQRVQAARAFLDGQDRTLFAVLERDLGAAAAALAFERAAALRDQLAALRWLDDQLERLRHARERFSFVYPVAGTDGRDCWYLIHAGRIAAVLAAPRNAAERQAAATAIEAVYYRSRLGSRPPTLDQIDAVLLIVGWFRRQPQEYDRIMQPAAALDLLTTQLARRE
jgi:excinuclease ABC subunit C